MAVGWYVLRSKPRKEDFVYGQLLARNIEAYFPKICVHPVNPRARKSKPYFPGYLFVHVDLKEKGLSVLQWLPGSIGFVAFGGEPACVPEALIRTIQKKIATMNAAQKDAVDFHPGDEVLIQDGPFAGYRAIFRLSLPGSERVRVLLKFLEDQNMRLELPANQIAKYQSA